MYGHVFLYTVVVPDTYRFTQEYTVWPYDALNQGDGADKLLSIWSPNVPHDPLPLLQYLPGISCSWFGQGSCTASLLRFHLHHAHVTKINTEIKADVTLGRCQEKWQQVRGGIAWTSQICYLVWGMLVDSWDSTSEALFFLVFFFLGEQSSQRRLPLIAEILKSPLLPIWRESGLTCSCLKKRFDPWCKCRPWSECSTSAFCKFVE